MIVIKYIYFATCDLFFTILHFSRLIMWKIRIRAVIGVMIFLGYFLIYVIRYSLSVHIIAMSQILKSKESMSITTSSYDIYQRNRKRVSANVDIINWNDMKVARLFSAYHIGYCVCFPIFHSFGDRLGPTLVVGISGIISGMLNCLTPSATFYHYWALFLVRMLQGFCAGAMQPSMVQVLRHWVPPVERNHFMWAYCGITIGTCCTFLICVIVHYYSTWPVGFYICGCCQILWAILWILVVTDYPRHHHYISREELEYLDNTIGTIFTIKLANSQTPWRLILRSIPFWALCILNFGYAWMIIAVCLHGPLFYSKILDYDLYKASALTALPFFLRMVIGTATIQTFHWYRHNSDTNSIKMKHVRKYFIVVSHILPGIIVGSLWFFPKIIPGPILLTLAVALTAAGMDITLDLCYALTPKFVNSVNTMIKIIGNTAGIIVSLGVGHVTYTYKNTAYVWKHIWCFHATVLFVSGVVFLIWGETSVQDWNWVRPRPRTRKRYIIQKLSRMSNITEVEEDNSLRGSFVTKSIQSNK